MKFRDVLAILHEHKFSLDRQSGSHRQYIGMVGGSRRLVTLAYHTEGEDVLPKTLASIIRQSGLAKKLFK